MHGHLQRTTCTCTMVHRSSWHQFDDCTQGKFQLYSSHTRGVRRNTCTSLVNNTTPMYMYAYIMFVYTMHHTNYLAYPEIVFPNTESHLSMFVHFGGSDWSGVNRQSLSWPPWICVRLTRPWVASYCVFPSLHVRLLLCSSYIIHVSIAAMDISLWTQLSPCGPCWNEGS